MIRAVIKMHSMLPYKALRMAAQYSQNDDKQLYLTMLRAYQRNMKKPTEEQKSVELKILRRMLSLALNEQVGQQTGQCTAENPNQVIQYVAKLRHYKLFTEEALNEITQYMEANWQHLSTFSKASSLCLMVEQGRYDIFHAHQKQLLSNGLSVGTQEQKIIRVLHNYCNYIITRSIELPLGHLQQPTRKEDVLSNRYKEWQLEYDFVCKVNKILNGTSQKQGTNTVEREQHKKRSNLEIQIEALLKTLGYQFQRQVNIHGYYVDFVIHPKKIHPKAELRGSQGIGKISSCILQVMGSHHYTVEYKIFGKDVVRALILQRHMPVAMVHANDFNIIKGLQNKLVFLENIIEDKMKQMGKKSRNSDWKPTTPENKEQNARKMNEYKEQIKRRAEKMQFDLKNSKN